MTASSTSPRTRACRRCKSPVALDASACDFCGAYQVELATGGSNREAFVLGGAAVLALVTFGAIVVPLGQNERAERHARAAEWARQHPAPTPAPSSPPSPAPVAASPSPALSPDELAAAVASASETGPRGSPPLVVQDPRLGTAPVSSATPAPLVLVPEEPAPSPSPTPSPTPTPSPSPSPSPSPEAPPPVPSPSPAAVVAPVAIADLPPDERVWDGHQWERTAEGHRHGPSCSHVLVGARWQLFAVEPRIYDGPVQDYNLKRPDDGLYDFRGQIYWLRDHVHGASCGHRYGVYGWFLPEAR